MSVEGSFQTHLLTALDWCLSIISRWEKNFFVATTCLQSSSKKKILRVLMITLVAYYEKSKPLILLLCTWKLLLYVLDYFWTNFSSLKHATFSNSKFKEGLCWWLEWVYFWFFPLQSWKHGEDQSSCPYTFRRPCIDDRKLKFSATVWFRILWNLAKFQLIQTNI